MTIKKLEGRLGRTRKELAKARHIILLLGRENVRLRGVTSLLWEQCKALNVMPGYDLERQVRAATREQSAIGGERQRLFNGEE